MSEETSSAHLICRAGNVLCALPLRSVIETMRPLPVTPLNGAPLFVQGVSIIRGRAAPVLQMAMLVGNTALPQVNRFVTIIVGDRRVALAVEAVLGIRQLSQTSLRELPGLFNATEDDVLTALGTLDAELLVVLHTAHLVPESVWQAIEIQEITAA